MKSFLWFKSFLLLLLILHHDFIQIQVNAASFKAYSSISKSLHASNKHSHKRTFMQTRTMEDPCINPLDISSGRPKSNALSKQPSSFDLEETIRPRSNTIDLTKEMKKFALCAANEHDRKKAMASKMRFFVSLKLTPCLAISECLNTLNTLSEIVKDVKDLESTKNEIASTEISLDFGFTIIHLEGKKFEFEPIIPLEGFVKAIANLIDTRKDQKNEKIMTKIKNYWEANKEKLKTQLKEMGKSLLKAITKAVLKWLFKFIVGSVIVSILPVLLPLVMIYQIVTIIMKFRKSKITDLSNGQNSFLLSYILGDFKPFGSLTLNLELIADVSAIKNFFKEMVTNLKKHVQECLDWLKAKFKKFLNFITRKKTLAKEDDGASELGKKFDAEADGIFENFENTVENHSTEITSAMKNATLLKNSKFDQVFLNEEVAHRESELIDEKLSYEEV